MSAPNVPLPALARIEGADDRGARPAATTARAAVSLLSAWMFGAGVWVMRRG